MNSSLFHQSKVQKSLILHNFYKLIMPNWLTLSIFLLLDFQTLQFSIKLMVRKYHIYGPSEYMVVPKWIDGWGLLTVVNEFMGGGTKLTSSVYRADSRFAPSQWDGITL